MALAEQSRHHVGSCLLLGVVRHPVRFTHDGLVVPEPRSDHTVRQTCSPQCLDLRVTGGVEPETRHVGARTAPATVSPGTPQLGALRRTTTWTSEHERGRRDTARAGGGRLTNRRSGFKSLCAHPH